MYQTEHLSEQHTVDSFLEQRIEFYHAFPGSHRAAGRNAARSAGTEIITEIKPQFDVHRLRCLNDERWTDGPDLTVSVVYYER